MADDRWEKIREARELRGTAIPAPSRTFLLWTRSSPSSSRDLLPRGRGRGRKYRIRRIKGHASGFYWEPHDEIVTLARRGGRTVVMQRSREMETEIISFEKNPNKVTICKFGDEEGRRGELFYYKSSDGEIICRKPPKLYIALSEGLFSANPREMLRILFRLVAYTRWFRKKKAKSR